MKASVEHHGKVVPINSKNLSFIIARLLEVMHDENEGIGKLKLTGHCGSSVVFTMRKRKIPAGRVPKRGTLDAAKGGG